MFTNIYIIILVLFNENLENHSMIWNLVFRPFERSITLHKDSTGHVGFQYKDGEIKAIVVGSSAARNGLLINHNMVEVCWKSTSGKFYPFLFSYNLKSLFVQHLFSDQWTKCRWNQWQRSEWNHWFSRQCSDRYDCTVLRLPTYDEKVSWLASNY